MANVIGKTRGYRKSGAPRQQADQTALGDGCVRSEANTWRTFATIHMDKDGSGFFFITRQGYTVEVSWNAETQALEVRQERGIIHRPEAQ